MSCSTGEITVDEPILATTSDTDQDPGHFEHPDHKRAKHGLKSSENT